MTPHDLADLIDHTNLKADATESDIQQTCEEAIAYGFASVVCNPSRVHFVASLLRGRQSKAVSVAGFPLGASRTEIKVAESVRAAIDGATEIDLVANIGWLKDGRFKQSATEISEIRRAVPKQVGLKVIIETSLLTPEQQTESVKACLDGGAQFVKSSTGFQGGATLDAIRHLVQVADGRIKIKASGGIITLADCQAMIDAGAARIGSSASVAIMQELLQQSANPGS